MAASTIGAGTVIRGNLRGDGDVEILGRVEGGVSMSGDVTLGEHAAVLGDVSGTALSIDGAVQGDLRGTDSVMLGPTARVVGDIGAPRIGIAEGALVRGNVATDGESSGAPRARSSSRAEPVRRAEPAPARQEENAAAKRPAPAPARRPAPAKAAPAKAAPAKAAPAKAAPAKVAAAKAAPAKRQPPPPVVPALRRGTRAKKKTRRR